MQNTRGAAVWVLASFQNLFLEIIKKFQPQHGLLYVRMI